MAVEAPAGARKIVLVGNPNVGKSLFFNAFTGLYVDVSNFPGTTVAISSGRMGDDVVLDTPGIYGVSSFNDEETVARDIVMEADIVVNVVDAVHLERDLFLTQQVIDMGLPMVGGPEHDRRGRSPGRGGGCGQALPPAGRAGHSHRGLRAGRGSTRCAGPSIRPARAVRPDPAGPR